jgi:hypothetical protein
MQHIRILLVRADSAWSFPFGGGLEMNDFSLIDSIGRADLTDLLTDIDQVIDSIMSNDE